MEIDFQGWLYECFANKCLTEVEIDELLKDERQCYDLLVDHFFGQDQRQTAEMVKEQLMIFKRRLQKR